MKNSSNVDWLNKETGVIKANNQINIEKKESNILTNDQKLEYISKLILNVDQKIKTSELKKKLIK